MTHPEINQPHEPSDEIALAFAALVGQIGETHTAPSIAQQHETLSLLRQGHAKQQQEAGITGLIYDALPESFIGDGLDVSLRRVLLRQPDDTAVIENYVGATYTEQSRNDDGIVVAKMRTVFLPVSREFSGVREPISPFDADQADLIAGQMGELERMKVDGFLPNLQADLSGIFDPATSMRLKPPADR